MPVYTYPPDYFAKTFPNISIESIIRPLTLRLTNPKQSGPFSAYLILFVIGIIGNSCVAAVIGRLVAYWARGGGGVDTPAGASVGSRGMHIYILALCCFDLLALACLPLLLLDLAFGQWTVPYTFVCKLYVSGECLTKFGGPFLLVALSGFCYFSICRGNRPLIGSMNLGSSKVALWVIVACVVIVVLIGAPMWYYGGIYYVVIVKNDTPVELFPKCLQNAPDYVMTAFMAFSFAFGFLLPAALFTYFYSAVLYHVHRHANRMRGSKKARYFWKAAKTSMCLVIFYLACWTPFWCQFLYYHFGGASSPALTVLSYFIHTLPYVNCCGYPIIFTAMNTNLRNDYDRVARRSREKKEQSRQMQKSTTWAGRGQQSHVDSQCGYTNRTVSPDRSRSVETVFRGKSPTMPLCAIEDDEELVQIKM